MKADDVADIIEDFVNAPLPAQCECVTPVVLAGNLMDWHQCTCCHKFVSAQRVLNDQIYVRPVRLQ